MRGVADVQDQFVEDDVFVGDVIGVFGPDGRRGHAKDDVGGELRPADGAAGQFAVVVLNEFEAVLSLDQRRLDRVELDVEVVPAVRLARVLGREQREGRLAAVLGGSGHLLARTGGRWRSGCKLPVRSVLRGVGFVEKRRRAALGGRPFATPQPSRDHQGTQQH